MLLGLGVCAALLHAARTGVGQVVDAAMVDGVAQLMTSIFGTRAQGHWSLDREANLLDGGAPFYDVYRTSDARFVSIAALERRFFTILVEALGLRDDPVVQDRMNPATWPDMRVRFTEIFASRTRAEWCELLEGTDACFAPVLDLDEAPTHPHNAARATYRVDDRVVRPSPAPRFSVTPSGSDLAAPRPGEHTAEVLAEWGITAD